MMTIRNLTIKLKGSDSPISRRLQVPDQLTMDQLHLLIQTAMPWNNSHYYEFNVKDREYWRECEDELDSYREKPRNRVAARWTFAKFLDYTKAKKFRYLYDTRVQWIHELKVGAIIQPKPNEIYPKLMTAKEVCPRDDILGGIWPYNQFRKIIKKPKHRDYNEAKLWLGEDFDPDVDVFPLLKQNVEKFAQKLQ